MNCFCLHIGTSGFYCGASEGYNFSYSIMTHQKRIELLKLALSEISHNKRMGILLCLNAIDLGGEYNSGDLIYKE